VPSLVDQFRNIDAERADTGTCTAENAAEQELAEKRGRFQLAGHKALDELKPSARTHALGQAVFVGRTRGLAAAAEGAS